MAKNVHPIDWIEFHKQAREMIYSIMTNKATSLQKLQTSLENIIAQFKLEKASSHIKDNRIKSSEELVIKVGYNPNDIKAAEKLIKKEK